MGKRNSADEKIPLLYELTEYDSQTKDSNPKTSQPPEGIQVNTQGPKGDVKTSTGNIADITIDILYQIFDFLGPEVMRLNVANKYLNQQVNKYFNERKLSYWLKAIEKSLPIQDKSKDEISEHAPQPLNELCKLLNITNETNEISEQDPQPLSEPPEQLNTTYENLDNISKFIASYSLRGALKHNVLDKIGYEVNRLGITVKLMECDFEFGASHRSHHLNINLALMLAQCLAFTILLVLLQNCEYDINIIENTTNLLARSINFSNITTVNYCDSDYREVYNQPISELASISQTCSFGSSWLGWVTSFALNAGVFIATYALDLIWSIGQALLEKRAMDNEYLTEHDEFIVPTKAPTQPNRSKQKDDIRTYNPQRFHALALSKLDEESLNVSLDASEQKALDLIRSVYKIWSALNDFNTLKQSLIKSYQPTDLCSRFTIISFFGCAGFYLFGLAIWSSFNAFASYPPAYDQAYLLTMQAPATSFNCSFDHQVFPNAGSLKDHMVEQYMPWSGITIDNCSNPISVALFVLPFTMSMGLFGAGCISAITKIASLSHNDPLGSRLISAITALFLNCGFTFASFSAGAFYFGVQPDIEAELTGIAPAAAVVGGAYDRCFNTSFFHNPDFEELGGPSYSAIPELFTLLPLFIFGCWINCSCLINMIFCNDTVHIKNELRTDTELRNDTDPPTFNP